MNESIEATPPAESLWALRVAAAIGVVVAIVAVVVGFSFGAIYGVLALVALPAIPLLFVLGLEALRRNS